MIVITGYLRCSTKKQSSHNGHVSISMQKKTIFKHLVYIGLVEKMSDIVWYVDEGVSGESLDRPGMQKLIKDIEEGRVNIVAAYDFARISRDVIESNMFINLVKKKGVRICCVYDTYNAKTADGRMSANVKFAINQYEREKDVERTNDGLLALVEVHHRYPSAIVPFGYKLVDKNIFINENADLVKNSFYMIEDGYSVDEVRDYLNSIQNEQFFNNERISRLLRNIKYSGFLLYKDNIYCDIVPKIIEPKIQAHVIELLDMRRRTYHFDEYLLRDLVYCKECDRKMYSVFGTSRNGNKYFYYRCSKCGKYYPQKRLESQLFTMNLKDDNDNRYKINTKQNIINLKRNMKDLNDKMLSGFIDKDTYNEMKKRYEKKIRVLESMLPGAKTRTLTSDMSKVERIEFYQRNFYKVIVSCKEKEIDEVQYLHIRKRKKG